MTEQELMEKIRLSAADVEIPEGVSPEAMKRRLDAAKQSGDEAGGDKSRKRRWSLPKGMTAAAAVLVCTAGVLGLYQMRQQAQNAATGGAELSMAEQESAAMDMASEESVAATGAEDAACDVAPAKSSAGNLYVVAGDYGEVYDLIEKSYEDNMCYDTAYLLEGESMDEAFDMKQENAATGGAAPGVGMSGPDAGAVTEDATADTAGSYAKTNLQTEGVDESDIVKTDGSYIYVVNDDVVKIVDIKGDEMVEIGEIAVSMNSAADRVMEMYVDGDTLSIIVEREDTQLGEGDGSSSAQEQAGQQARASMDVYYVNSSTVTELITYDIRNRRKPVLSGSVEQEGFYSTSRKIDAIVYLFTVKSMEMPSLAKSEAIRGEHAGDWIPLVNGEAVAANCIYMPTQGTEGLVISSIDVESPDAVVDNALIINNYVNIYVSTDALYLYHSNYSGSSVTTQVAKFGLEGGIIDAVGAASAAGEVYDTFAIHDYQGNLRLLTTDWSKSEQENQLYLFDEKLKLTGSLKGIARGEQIYAARYLGDTAYFVTYRNTDPLFAVDLSDEKKPKILSELKITGFSEYLHFWGEDKLLGIGYETDPKSGEREGIKLTMFDISDPAELRTLGTCVLENIDYSPALYNYKCVLADAEENIIGFMAEAYDQRTIRSYFIFSWEDGKFCKLMTEAVGDADTAEEFRGIYVGKTFYLVNTEWITSYDREKSYKKLQTLELL